MGWLQLWRRSLRSTVHCTVFSLVLLYLFVYILYSRAFKAFFHLQPTWAYGVVLLYLYSIHRTICRPTDRFLVRPPRTEIRTRDWEGILATRPPPSSISAGHTQRDTQIPEGTTPTHTKIIVKKRRKKGVKKGLSQSHHINTFKDAHL